MQHPVNHLKIALKSGKFQLGLWSGLCSPLAAESLSHSPVDWVTIDMEHSPNTLDLVVQQLRAMQGGKVSPVVRPPWNDFVILKQLLDAGAQTFIIPYVQNADEARKAVEATRYPPKGIRGVAGGSRATLYGRVDNYFKNADEHICVIVQVESYEAFEKIDEILAVDGVDGIFIGPADLSASMGILGQLTHPDLQKTMVEAAKKINKSGKVAASLSFDPQQAKTYAQMGYQMMAAGSDIGLLNKAAVGVAQIFSDFKDK